MSTTAIGYTCVSCGMFVLGGTHYCKAWITPQTYGWICPRCGTGNAPSNSRCECVQVTTITYTNPNVQGAASPGEPEKQ